MLSRAKITMEAITTDTHKDAAYKPSLNKFMWQAGGSYKQPFFWVLRAVKIAVRRTLLECWAKEDNGPL